MTSFKAVAVISKNKYGGNKTEWFDNQEAATMSIGTKLYIRNKINSNDLEPYGESVANPLDNSLTYYRWYKQMPSGNKIYSSEQVESIIQQLEAQLASKQAQIDQLMLEYCPENMSAEQVQEWERHQKVAK